MSDDAQERIELLKRLTYFGIPVPDPGKQPTESLRLAVWVAERNQIPEPCGKCTKLAQDLEIARIREQGAVAAALQARQERDQVQARYDDFVRNAVEITQRQVPTPIVIIQKEGPADGK